MGKPNSHNNSHTNYVKRIIVGDPVSSIVILLESLVLGYWFVIAGRPIPPAFIYQMRLATLLSLIASGQMFFAIDSATGENYRSNNDT